MQKYDRCLIDVSNIYYRAYYANSNAIITSQGKQLNSGGILVALRILSKIEKLYLKDNGRIYYLFDNAFSIGQRRQNIDPAYKVNRRKKEIQFYRGLDYLQMVLSHYKNGYRVIRKPESEADDLVLPVLNSFGENRYLVLLVSNDMDWARGISENTHWLVSMDGKDTIYDRSAFKEKYGFCAGCNEVCLYKALKGDTADNIPQGVPGIPKDVVLTIINKAHSTHNMFIMLTELPIDNKWKDAIYANRGRIKLNLSLVSYASVSIDECRACTTISEFNKKLLIDLYTALGFIPCDIDERLTSDSLW